MFRRLFSGEENLIPSRLLGDEFEVGLEGKRLGMIYDGFVAFLCLGFSPLPSDLSKGTF